MTTTVKLKHEDINSFSIDGVQYDANDKGVFDLPEDVAAQAVALYVGFTTVPARAAKTAEA